MTNEKTLHAETWHSREADAAGARWGETHPDEDPEHLPPSPVPEDDEVVPNHHSASAEAASLRWHEQHEDLTAQGPIATGDSTETESLPPQPE